MVVAVPTREVLLTAALRYAELGWRVFPCLAGQKIPATSHGVKDATCDPERIRAWWERSSYNIGIATGPESGFFCVDVDPRNGGAYNVAFPTALTGGGGNHWYYRWPDGVSKMRATLSQGVDVKGAGGYVIAPPSVTEGQYVWLWDDYSIPEAPADVLSRIAIIDNQVVEQRPGDRFNEEHSWAEILEPHGWNLTYDAQLANGAIDYWTRPGKDAGISATTGVRDSGAHGRDPADLFYVFTTSTQFEANRGYDKFTAYCLDPYTPVLSADLTWRLAGSLQPGDEIMGVDEEASEKNGRRKLRVSIVEEAARRDLHCYRVTFEDGRVITASDEHGWLIKSAGVSHNTRWAKTKDLVVGQRVCAVTEALHFPEREFEDGWLSGMFDGEGWASKYYVGLAQKAGPVLERVKTLLTERAYPFKEYANAKGVSNVMVSGVGNQLRLLMHVRPGRLLSKRHWVGCEVSSRLSDDAVVKSVEPVGVREVAAVQTSTRTIIANGLITHNTILNHGGDFSAAAQALAEETRPRLRPTLPTGLNPELLKPEAWQFTISEQPRTTLFGSAISGYSFEPALPPEHFVSKYIAYGNAITDAASEYHEAAALAMLSAITGPVRIELAFSPGGLRTNLFLALVGESSRSRKSTAQSIAGSLLGELLWEAMIPDSMSGEAGIQQLAQRSGKPAVWLPDELGQEIQQIYRRDFKSALENVLLQLYGGRTFRYVTLSGSNTVEDVHLVILGAATPESFAGSGNRSVTSGLLPRFGIVYPAVLPPSRPPRAAAPEFQQMRSELKAALYATQSMASMPGGRREVTLTPEAMGAIAAADNKFSGSSMTSRLSTGAFKIAALLALADASWTVTQAHAEAAVKIGERWAGGALRLRSVLGRSAQDLAFNETLDNARQLLERLPGNGTVAGRKRIPVVDVARALGVEARTLKRIQETLQVTEEIVVIPDEETGGQMWAWAQLTV